MGFDWFFKLLAFVGQFVGLSRREPNIEPLLDGYEGLSRENAKLIRSLGKRIEHLEDQNERLIATVEKNVADIEECNRHRGDLQATVDELQATVEELKAYAHSRVHEFENFSKFLAEDL